MRSPGVRALFAIILGLFGTPVLAQQQQHSLGGTPAAAATPGPEMCCGEIVGAGAMAMTGMMQMMMGAGGMRGMDMMAGHVEGRLAFLKTELKITNAQLPLWTAVADAIRANAKNTGEMPGGMMRSSQAATLPEKLALREKMMTTHLEALRRLQPAIDPRYAALSDEQKKTADELLAGPMGMM